MSNGAPPTNRPVQGWFRGRLRLGSRTFAGFVERCCCGVRDDDVVSGRESLPPSGTVTFLFTDIEGSTRLWEEHRGGMERALERHDELLRAAFASAGGYVFATGGDGFGVAFERGGDAVIAAGSAQAGLGDVSWPDGVELKVRMGVHTGEVQERGGDYFGPAVNVAARVMSCASGGQVLVSDVTRQLLDDAVLTDLGEHRLRGVADRVRIWQLGDGPPGRLRLGGEEGNLPVPVTSFIGRRRDVEELVGVIAPGRLVTLVGVGGVGKTRLAIEAAASVTDDFPDGVWFCELAPVGDPASVVDAVAATLGVWQQQGMSMLESIADSLAGRRMLVVLDNCEHVLEPAAFLVAILAERARSVALVASSREPLGVAGERVWPVPSLDAAVELFCARAEEADARFEVDSARLEVIERICGQLDGIPLAIELAAARVRSMTVTDIAARLSDRFRLLRGSGRGGVERHQTLAATVQWSCDLLGEAERVLFERLCVFAGSFDLAAVEAVCTDPGLIDEYDVVDLLSSLVDKSMVTADRSGPTVRFRLLETFRQFGEQRVDHDRMVALRERHLDYYLGAATEADRLSNSGGSERSDRMYSEEWDNIRAAMLWALAIEDRVRSTALLKVAHYYAMWNLMTEPADWARQLIALGEASAYAYGVVSFWHGIAGEFSEQVRVAREGLDATSWDVNADSSFLWGPYSGGLSRTAGRDEAESATRSAYLAATEFTPEMRAYWAAVLAINLASPCPEEAAELAAEAEGLLTSDTHPHLAASTCVWLARYYALSGNLGQAARRIEQASEICRRHSLPWETAMTATTRAFVAALGGFPDPRGAFHEAVHTAYQSRAWFDLWPCLHSLVRWWSDTGDLQHAGVVFGHLQARRGGAEGDVAGISHRSRALIESDPDHPQWLAQGAAMDRDQLVEYSLAALR